MLTDTQKILGLLAHLGIFIGLPILSPLIIFFISSDPIIKYQAKEALGFQIGMIILGTIANFLVIFLIGIPLLLALGIITIIFPIIAAYKFFKYGHYSYPITGNFIQNV